MEHETERFIGTDKTNQRTDTERLAFVKRPEIGLVTTGPKNMRSYAVLKRNSCTGEWEFLTCWFSNRNTAVDDALSREAMKREAQEE